MLIPESIYAGGRLYSVRFADTVLEDLFDNKVTRAEVVRMVNNSADYDAGLLDGNDKFFQLFEAYVIGGRVSGRTIVVESMITRKSFMRMIDEMG